MTPTYQQLFAIQNKLGYKFFDSGNMNLNLIFHRVDDEITNLFTDFLYLAYRDNGLPVVKIFSCTTKPGKNNITCSAVVPGFYPHAWEWKIQDLPPSNLQMLNPWIYDYGASIGTINCYTVPPLANMIVPDEVQHITGKINLHCMGLKLGNHKINNFSEGCFGFDYDTYIEVTNIIRKSIPSEGNILSFTLLENKNFENVV